MAVWDYARSQAAIKDLATDKKSPVTDGVLPELEPGIAFRVVLLPGPWFGVVYSGSTSKERWPPKSPPP